MKVDHILILAAGKGTRMGEIGKKLPKVIWPIFEKSLLELQVEYAKLINPHAKIYINIYNYQSIVLEHIKRNPNSFKNVIVLKEEELLDIGGGVHNLAKTVTYTGNLLILNSDQFLFCKPELINNSLNELNSFDSLLFSYKVNSSDGYNALDIHEKLFKGVIKNTELKRNENMVTYTGMSLIDLSKLTPRNGESKFFDSVCGPKLNQIGVQEISDFEYWDFGTIDRYVNSMRKALKNRNSDFFKFLKDVGGIKENLVFKNGYNSETSIQMKSLRIGKAEIAYKDIIQPI